MTRRRSGFPCGTIVLGLALMPVICAVTFFGLVLAAEAMGVGSLSQLETVVMDLVASTGLVPAALEPTSFDPAPSLTPFQPLSTEPVPSTETPSPTASLTASPSATSTPSTTPTETPTSTGTTTLTPSATSTASPSPSATIPATRTRTPTLLPTRTPTRTLTGTATQTPSPTASMTSEIPPTLGVPTATSEVPPTVGAPTATSEVPPTVAIPTATPTVAPTASACDASANASVEAEVIDLVNTERAAQGLAAYSVDGRLTAAARVHATDMACNHFTSHTGSDGSSVRDRVVRQGYTWSWIGENYFVGGSGAQTAFNWWMNSTPHRNNLLSPNYTQFGVGYVYDADSDYGGYFVVVFAKPG